MSIKINTYRIHKTAATEDLTMEKLRDELERLRRESPTAEEEEKEFLDQEAEREDELLGRLTAGQCLMCGHDISEDNQNPFCRECIENVAENKEEVPADVKKFVAEEGLLHPDLDSMDDEEWDKYFYSMFGELPEKEPELMDPKKIEETYRDVSEEEIEERTGPSMYGPDVENPYLGPKWTTYPGQYPEYVVEKKREKIDPSWLEKAEPGALRPLGISMVQKLIKIANSLDQKGLYDEANIIDEIVKEADKGIPSFQYKKLKKCIEDKMTYEECKEELPKLTKENYDEMKEKLNA